MPPRQEILITQLSWLIDFGTRAIGAPSSVRGPQNRFECEERAAMGVTCLSYRLAARKLATARPVVPQPPSKYMYTAVGRT